MTRNKRGQATIEFMMIFLVTLITVMAIAASLVKAGEKAKETESVFSRIIAVEEATRAIEVTINSGIEMDLKTPGVSSSIENGRLHVGYRGRIIEAEGIFDGYSVGGRDAEPV